jgi:16S rRNA (uracil1498-N3)-methyltransferase
VGQCFDVAAGETLRSGRITSVTPERVEFELGEEIPALATPNISLLLAIFKFDRMEWAIEKCAELGVARIVPVIARRTDSHLVRAADKRVERWRRLGQQASEQSRRTTVVMVNEPMKLKDAASLSAPTRVVLAESERHIMLKDSLQSHLPSDELLIAVGPEGGWTEDEIGIFFQRGWKSASLGSTILRAETAAIAATAIAMSELS